MKPLLTRLSLAFFLGNGLFLPLLCAQGEYPINDTTFNQFGYRVIDHLLHFIPQVQTIQPDGKILIGGYGQKLPDDYFDVIMYRLNPDGKIDSSFATNGELIFDIDGGHDALDAISVLPDNKILLGINSSTRIFVARLLGDGSFDPDFGLDGLVLTEAKASEYLSDMAIQSDNKIILAGEDVKQGVPQGMLRRLNADGTSDQNFGSQGYVQFNIDPSKQLRTPKCLLQPDGKIITSGYYSIGATSGYPLFRFNTDGTLDPSFSGDGKFLKQLGVGQVSAQAGGLALLPDGSILVAGSAPANNPLYPVMVVIKVRSNGITDGTFGAFGVAKADYGGSVFCNDLIVQPDGKIIMGGYVFNSDTSCIMAYARLNSAGGLDNSWGYQGRFGESLYDPNFNVQVITDLDLDEQSRLVACTWRNDGVDLVNTIRAGASVSRYFLGLAVGVNNLSNLITDFKVFPNPIGNEKVTLSYFLEETTNVSISLSDISGRLIAELSPSEEKQAGDQFSTFYLPQGLAAGTYFAVVQAGTEQRTIPLVKK